MTIPDLKDSTGKVVPVDKGRSTDLVVTFHDMAGAAIVEASLITLTLTLYDQATRAVINSRSAQNVKDANDGTVATDGTLTLRLGPSDNVIVTSSTAVGDTEAHVARLQWTWSDGTATRYGFEERLIHVRQVATPT